MTRAYTKGAKLKAKRAAMPELAPIGKRRPCGRHVEYEKGAKDPAKTALGARCRMFGVPDTPANRKALAGQHSGAQLGMVIERQCRKSDIQPLWQVWQGFCSAMRTYRARILSIAATPQNAALAMMPEHIETDTGHSVDLRDGDTKDRDAVRAYMRWHGLLMHLPAGDRTRLHDAELERGSDLWRDGEPTRAGLATLAALNALAVAERGG